MIDFAQASPFNQLAALLILAGMLGFAAMKLRQPLIVAFIATGIFAGRDFLNIVGPDETLIGALADLGVALLLFMVGLQLDLTLMRTMGPVATVTGSVAITAMTALGGGICLLFGMAPVAALFCGAALSLSSTIIVVKLLSDQRAIDSLHGRISLGILIVEDLAIIAAIVVVAGIGGAATDFTGIIMKMMILIAGTGLFIRYVANPLTRALGKQHEMMMIFSLALAATVSGLCEHWGLSRELGGLLAGIALASSPMRNMIAARLSPLRDFLLLFFFVSLGAQINPAQLSGAVLPGLALSALVLLGKPGIIMLTIGALGYRKRTAFMSAITLSQVSEFSLVFTAMGADMGFIGQQTLEVITFVTLVSIAISTYAVTYSAALFRFVDARIGLFEHKVPKRENVFRKIKSGSAASTAEEEMKQPHDVLIFGLGRYGLAMAKYFLHNKISVLGVDFDPRAISAADAEGVPAYYADAADAELPGIVPLGKVQIIIFAFQHHLTDPFAADSRESLARGLREAGFTGRIVSTSHAKIEEERLRHQGIDTVLYPFEDAAACGADYVLKLLEAPQMDTAV
jgi:Kef-type K+ transport system membrane component KefB